MPREQLAAICHCTRLDMVNTKLVFTAKLSGVVPAARGPFDVHLDRSSFLNRYWRSAWGGSDAEHTRSAEVVQPILPTFTLHEGRHSHSTWSAEAVGDRSEDHRHFIVLERLKPCLSEERQGFSPVKTGGARYWD
ncbi:hypothetical protein [Amycolatopsis sp. lyj-90]|uniref:hypothetical protein n=1 Tax=Amycolatopsis sp. lyj-90 TaxID=2789285 RepID=UPI003979149B